MGVIGEPKCIEWGKWYDDIINPCIQHRKCIGWEEDPGFLGFFATEDNLGPGGTEQTPTDTLTLTENSDPKYVGFFIGGILGLIWIAYRQ
tara:strand:+ start:1376 stop:1645 length:270 start_codon:yes stop_codon:yes gene_type:complete